MYIKQITIQGFKSYKEQTVIEPFSARHNVVVGRNGSGKSNFFFAIRFVLSDAYTNMGREERQALLHEGAGPATMSAYVEVIFDNTDNRFPTGKEEVVLRRTIGLKKDEYSLDKKSASKSDVMNLLEAAGFSRSNPYYIVPQGRITSLTNAKDPERLALLKEVAGTRVYEQRRSESLKIMEETEMKRNKIVELLKYIEDRLTELDEEKEELKDFQEKDRERRCLEYTIYGREMAEVNESLDEIEDERRRELESSNQREAQFSDREKVIGDIERELREHRQDHELLTLEKNQLNDDRQEMLKNIARLDLAVKDLDELVRSTKTIKGKAFGELRQIDKEIGAKEKTLEQIVPDYEKAVSTENEIRERLAKSNLTLQSLYSKQGRSAQFRNKARRDKFLTAEIRNIKEAIEAQSQQSNELRTQISSSENRIKQMEVDISNVADKLDSRKRGVEEQNNEITTLKAMRDTLTDQRKELWREEARLGAKVVTVKEELRKSERALQGTMDKNTSAGLAAVQRIAHQHGLTGVYGPLYELFDVSERYRSAVEITGGQSLFHVVVDTDDTVTRILEVMNRERVGRVTFMPLNRLKVNTPQYPNAKDALPMIQKLSFDAKYEKAFMQVFGKTIICPNLEVASQYARSHNLNSITLDGDRVDRKGALTGGYHDVRRSRIEFSKKVRDWREILRTETEEHAKLKVEISRLDQEITKVLGKIELGEGNRRQAQGSREPLSLELAAKQRERETLKEALVSKEKALMGLEASIRHMEAQVKANEEELASEFSTGLTPQEHDMLDALNASSAQLKEELIKASEERANLESQKNNMVNTLEANLRRRRQELADSLESELEGDVPQQLKVKKAELLAAQKRCDEIVVMIQKIDEDLEDRLANITELSQSLERTRAEQQENTRRIERAQESAEKYLSRRALLLQKKEECTRNIRELGVLPEEAFEKYTQTSSQKLLKSLHKVNEHLKKFAHVNKKAFEQYNNFTKQRDTLTKRKEELDSSSAAIQRLIGVLDQRKDEAIQRTFKQVAKYFAEVFEKLVPAGRGQLIMQRAIDEQPDDDEDTDQPHSTIESYTGISIKVSFNSNTDEGLHMQQLSGGQKSLVSLALIFAIQQCDPAPFYLFDEIDANLDSAHRTAVAAMIHELADKAQFIITTFRPEMLARADKFYGVTFTSKVSHINCISKEDAVHFVEQEQPQ